MDKGAMLLLVGGVVFTIIVLLWPIFMVLSEVQGTTEQQLVLVSQSPWLYMANFFVASLIAPAITVLMLSYAFAVRSRLEKPLLARVGTLFMAAYVTLVSISYISQYTYLPRVLASGNLELALRWFFLSVSSHTYFLNQLGYACFGVAAFLIGYKLLLEKGITKAIGVLLWVSGALSVVAFVGLLLQVEAQGLMSIISGLLTLPMGILSILWGRKLLQQC